MPALFRLALTTAAVKNMSKNLRNNPPGTQQKWDRIYTASDTHTRIQACHVLENFAYLLPDSGTALDLACGLGGNALFLAEHGLHTTAMDISSVAIEKLNTQQHPLINVRCVDIDSTVLKNSAYDVIVVSNYLDRKIADAIVQAITPGGLLFYQTFVLDKTEMEKGPGNAAFLLKANELLSLFSDMQVLAFSDLGTCGNPASGFRNQSYLVAQRALI